MSHRRSLHILAAGVAAIGGLIAASPAAAVVTVATTVNFNTTTGGTYTTSGTGNNTAAIFKSTETVNGAKLNVRVSGWHATDQTATNPSADTATIEAAQVAVFNEGLGVIANGDAGGANNLHQIDNLDGVDFVVLQFDKAVTLTGFSRNLFPLAGINPSDSDAAYFGDTAGQLNMFSYDSALPLAGATFSEATWTQVLGGSTNNVANLSPAPATAASVWLIGADFKASRNDGFKLGALKVSYAAPAQAGAVPEPATWGMMIVGFGLVGAAARRRGAGSAATAAA